MPSGSKLLDDEGIKAVDDYIAQFPIEVRKLLQTIREIIREEAPDAREVISYKIPTFKLNGNLVHFAAFKDHIGFYPAPSAIEHFKSPLKNYKSAKGSIRFSLKEPLPFDLIREMVRFRVRENREK